MDIGADGPFSDITARRQAELQRDAAQTALQRAYAEMEQRVEERTAELVEINASLRAEIAEREHAEAQRDATREALQRRNCELELLNRASQVLNATLDPDQVLAVILDEARTLLGVVACSIWLVEADTGGLVCQQASGPGSEIVRGWRLAPGEGIAGWVAQNGKSAIVPDAQADDRHFQAIDEQTGITLCSILGVPLHVQQETIGVLLAVDTESGRFDATDLRLLESLSASASAAIKNARLHEQVRHHAKELEQRVADRTRELAVLYEVAAIAAQPLALDTALQRSLETVLAATGGSEGTIHLLDKERGNLYLAIQHGLPPTVTTGVTSLPVDQGLGKVVDRNVPLVVFDVGLDPRTFALRHMSSRTYVGVPMRARGQPVGVLGVLGQATQLQLSVEGLSLLTSVADEIAGLVESTRLRQRAERTAALEERARLARELHDSVTQSLYSVALFAESGRELAREGQTAYLESCLGNLKDIALQALKEMRLLVYELRPSTLASEGLVGALRQRLDAVEGRAGVKARLLVDGAVALPAPVEQELYRIVQEALNNALKHAKATSVTVHILTSVDQVELEVADDGRGFDPQAVPDLGGMGLSNMRERTERLGGSFAVLSAPGKGTRVKVSIGRCIDE